MDTGMSDRAAVVTGGSKGIGFCIAEGLLREGVTDLTLIARRRDQLEAATDRLAAAFPRATIVPIPTDLCVPEEVDAVAEQLRSRHVSVHTLVNNAGPILQGAPVISGPHEKWARTFETKALGAVRMARAMLPLMPDHRCASIVNIAGISGRSLLANASASGMTNAAVFAFTSYLAQEVAARGIRVNCVSPGLIRTDAWEQNAARLGSEQGVDGDAFMQGMAERLGVRLGGWGTPEQVADAVVFLASNRASYITGQVLAVDGGLANFVV
jgi:3-oxoacyl-[acyl-carrier protein] reductase